MQDTGRVGIVVGSRTDIAAADKAAAVLDELGVANEIRVISAHRAPELLARWIASAETRGIRCVIAIAGLAAHLPGVVASQTTLPVIGVPMPGGVADGLDALLAIVQMPKGVPVATVGVGNGENAGLLAATILAVRDPALRERLVARRAAQAADIAADAANEGLSPGGPSPARLSFHRANGTQRPAQEPPGVPAAGPSGRTLGAMDDERWEPGMPVLDRQGIAGRAADRRAAARTSRTPAATTLPPSLQGLPPRSVPETAPTPAPEALRPAVGRRPVARRDRDHGAGAGRRRWAARW